MRDKLNVIASIAGKDIVDALKNRFVIYQMVAVAVILFSIRGLTFIIEPPATQVIIFDPGDSSFTSRLEDSPQFNVQRVASLDELQQALSNLGFGLGPEMGLEIPPGIDTQLESPNGLLLEGYVSWANRGKSGSLQAEMESVLSDFLGEPVSINVEGNIITPPGQIGLLVGIVTMFAVTIILTIGIILVPNLMLEEKQNHTLDALLVSPASIGQVVTGKALAGTFYVLVTIMIVYLVYWVGVYSWAVTALFVIGSVFFAVSLGLLFGVVFDRQQEMTGWLSVVMIVLSGSIFLELINLDLPQIVERLLPWLPSVALANIFWASFSSDIDYQQVLLSFAVVVAVSGILFGYIGWRINRLDR